MIILTIPVEHSPYQGQIRVPFQLRKTLSAKLLYAKSSVKTVAFCTIKHHYINIKQLKM